MCINSARVLYAFGDVMFEWSQPCLQCYAVSDEYVAVSLIGVYYTFILF